MATTTHTYRQAERKILVCSFDILIIAFLSVSFFSNVSMSMADFDAIYEEDQLEEHYEEQTVPPGPEPIVIRGAGNMTV